MNELKELQEFAIWMTGCGYDFTQHEHYLKNKHLLTGEALTIPVVVGQSEQLHSCKYVKRHGESCSLNNNCKYPDCD